MALQVCSALVNGMPQYPPPAPSRGILGDLIMIISIAPGSEQYLKSNPLFSVLGEHGGFDCIHAAPVMM